MSGAEASPAGRPRNKRADARRNYDKLIAAARDSFAEDGISASLEEIARRAHVGIGTLYRHFPTRKDLFEGVYRNEVETLCQAAGDLADEPPLEALTGWLHKFVDYFATKRALAEALNHDHALFHGGRDAIHAAGTPLLRRAQDMGAVRSDASFDDVLRLVGGITMIQFTDDAQRNRVLAMALDGLRP
jgi:AcrR family transcriptional regulator